MIWRETGLWPKIGNENIGVDGRVIILLGIWAVHWMWLTFYIAIGCMAVLFVLETMGFDIYYGARRIRRIIAGDIVPTRRSGQVRIIN